MGNCSVPFGANTECGMLCAKWEWSGGIGSAVTGSIFRKAGPSRIFLAATGNFDSFRYQQGVDDSRLLLKSDLNFNDLSDHPISHPAASWSQAPM